MVRKRNGYYEKKIVKEIEINSNTSNNQINQPLLGDHSSDIEMHRFDQCMQFIVPLFYPNRNSSFCRTDPASRYLPRNKKQIIYK